ncbi:probable xyloglucan endotransglucosylase/hydrolase protein 26 [Typha angustifolia]|uniref:probable xyloglucan endotransglucosylase/hydrolase protein 26 n=1 Tax=Typha angustifolia TaxID=59011 RepID=UPI003C2E6EFD
MAMANSRALLLALVSLLAFRQGVVDATFGTDTVCTWGYNNCVNSGDNLTLILNQWSGSAIETKRQYLFGRIEMQIKLVPGNSAGTVTTYYAKATGSVHDEIDFEFLGNASGQPYTIHTNVFTQGIGNKEVQFKPWFDPTSDYHTYTIFWNPSQIVWSIDGTPIRVFKNRKSIGIPYPTSQPMKAYSSLWNADDWATQGGRVKTDWTKAPFIARYRQFKQDVCIWKGPISVTQCAVKAPPYWYNAPWHESLNWAQVGKMMNIRNKYMIYDYCKDTKRFNGQMPKECSLPPF